MKSENLLMQDLLSKYDITISQLAQKCGLADSTVYEYTGGRKKNIPVNIWRALFELTEDMLILELITGNSEIFAVPKPKFNRENIDNATLQKLIEKRRKDLECEMAILEILSDGKVDKTDHQSVETYKSVQPESFKLGWQIYSIITNEFQSNQ